jgi:cytochrome c-type biogenesis protein CcmF
MIYEIGEIFLRLGLISSLFGAIFSFINLRLAKASLIVVILSVFLSNFILLYALLSSNFSILYVINYTSRDLPLFYKFTAWWGGQAGSLMFWLFVLSVYTIFAFKILGRFSLFFILQTFLFFFILATYPANPFERLPISAPDGRGLNPLLQNIWMAIHPPLLYLGYIGTTFPIAFLLDSKDINTVRFWTVIAWAFLTLGILLGGRWAYLELGWGGYWAWDPVENASLFPWITLNSAIHTFYLYRTGSHRIWLFNLISLSFILSIVGTFITRSGIVESVHAFAFSDIGHYFMFYISILLILWVLANLYLFRSRQRRDYQPFTRGFYLAISNYVWMLILLIVLLGTFYPVITEAFIGVQLSLNKDFYTYATSPFFALILLLSLLSLEAKWDKPKILPNFKILILSLLLSLPSIFAKNPFLFLGLFVSLYYLFGIITLIKERGWTPSNLGHLGLALTALGIVLSWNLGKKYEIPFKFMETKRFLIFDLKHLGWQEYKGKNYEGVYAVLNVKAFGFDLGDIRAERRKYFPSGEVTSEAGILPLPPLGDLYAVIQGAEDDGTFYYEIYFNPGIQLVWIGPIIFALGGLMGVFRLYNSKYVWK